MNKDDLDGNFPESVYNGRYRDRTINEESMFSDDFNLEEETSHTLKHIEAGLLDMKRDYFNRLNHKKRNEMCDELIDMVRELKRYYPDGKYCQ